MTERRATYLDWNATTPMRPAVADAMRAALGLPANPSSVHRAGRAARQAVERARAQVAALAGVAASAVIFTSGGTEANHLALRGFSGRRVIVSAVEHDSVRLAVPDATLLPVDADGVADLAALERLLAPPSPALVSLMLANNETGVLQPVAEAARLAHAKGALLHCDAVQGVGKVPLDLSRLGADLLTVSAHKIGGPTGVGALVVAKGNDPAPLLLGGGQESGRRAGTENVAGIVGFGVAAEQAAGGQDDWAAVMALRDAAERRLLALAPEARIFGREVARLPNTSCIALAGLAAATQVMALDLAGVMVSAGAACSSGKVRRSHVLEAMGAAPDLADGAIRVSLGWTSSAADIDHLLEAWGQLHARTRASAA
jgi:cysteine desulfurase